MSQSINHVDHVAWMAHLDNASRYAEQLGTLAGHALDGPFDRTDFGVRVYMSWETGLELLAPLPGYDTDFNLMLTKALADRGEGVFAVVFGVPDMAQARERARSAGHHPAEPITTLGDGAPWASKLEQFSESFVGDFLGSFFIYGEIVYAPGVITAPSSPVGRA